MLKQLSALMYLALEETEGAMLMLVYALIGALIYMMLFAVRFLDKLYRLEETYGHAAIASNGTVQDAFATAFLTSYFDAMVILIVFVVSACVMIYIACFIWLCYLYDNKDWWIVKAFNAISKWYWDTQAKNYKKHREETAIADADLEKKIDAIRALANKSEPPAAATSSVTEPPGEKLPAETSPVVETDKYPKPGDN